MCHPMGWAAEDVVGGVAASRLGACVEKGVAQCPDHATLFKDAGPLDRGCFRKGRRTRGGAAHAEALSGHGRPQRW